MGEEYEEEGGTPWKGTIQGHRGGSHKNTGRNQLTIWRTKQFKYASRTGYGKKGGQWKISRKKKGTPDGKRKKWQKIETETNDRSL